MDKDSENFLNNETDIDKKALDIYSKVIAQDLSTEVFENSQLSWYAQKYAESEIRLNRLIIAGNAGGLVIIISFLGALLGSGGSDNAPALVGLPVLIFALGLTFMAIRIWLETLITKATLINAVYKFAFTRFGGKQIADKTNTRTMDVAGAIARSIGGACLVAGMLLSFYVFVSIFGLGPTKDL